jgi:hypothetical protein
MVQRCGSQKRVDGSITALLDAFAVLLQAMEILENRDGFLKLAKAPYTSRSNGSRFWDSQWLVEALKKHF